MSFLTSPMFASGKLNDEEYFTMLPDMSGVVYTGKEINAEILKDPATAVKNGSLKAVAILERVELPDGTPSIRAMPIGTLSSEHFRLFDKITNQINRTLSKAGGLMAVMPYVTRGQLENMAEVMISQSSPITGVTPEMAKELASKQIEHDAKSRALNMLSSLGYKPDMKVLRASAPVQVSDEYLVKEVEENTASTALLDATTVEVE